MRPPFILHVACTNLCAERDVDVVTQLNDCFQHDRTTLLDIQQKASITILIE
jgi:hypothetical protein